MSSLVAIVDGIFSWATLLVQVVLVVGVLWVLIDKRIILLVRPWALWGGFVISLVATAGSLFYSEVAGYTPCELCWYSRILIYPQVLLYGLALWKRQNNISLYGFWLSALGVVVAGYHYLLQRGVVTESSCDVVGYSAECAKQFVLAFGYITMPLMAVTAFAAIAALMGVLYFSHNVRYSRE